MKAERQSLIRHIIETQSISTQAELAQAIRKEGVKVTQATVCRDIKEMQLYKVIGKNGKYQYSIMTGEETQNSYSRFTRMFRDSVISINLANNMIVIRTLSGSAHVAGEVLDNLEWPEILGTIAGDNTILVICRSDQAGLEVLQRIRTMTGIVEESEEDEEPEE